MDWILSHHRQIDYQYFDIYLNFDYMVKSNFKMDGKDYKKSMVELH